ncbi:transcriptional regulator domain-containing protein [Rhizobium leguminosarum]|uniref:transcriptional regulator domain-containing protein n=1 Tax=Rhizobium leguminosarum TaxID=384 RepID=UPI001FE14ACB|nr:DUF6499 domain-containing protein [Rhizobium leguminosarum]
MASDTSEWRSSSSYDYVEQLNAPDIGWEWLRRNEDYQRDFARVEQTSDRTSLMESVGPRWGLRFPSLPRFKIHRD